MSEQRRWLRFCYYTPFEYEDEKTGEPNGQWVYGLAAIRSDGYLYVCYEFEDSRLSDDKEISRVKKLLWDKLETFIEDIPENVKPFPNADRINKGKIHQDGNEWVEVEDGAVEELK